MRLVTVVAVCVVTASLAACSTRTTRVVETRVVEPNPTVVAVVPTMPVGGESYRVINDDGRSAGTLVFSPLGEGTLYDRDGRLVAKVVDPVSPLNRDPLMR
jgi:hypothetical protein